MRYILICLLLLVDFAGIAQEQTVPVNIPQVIETSACIYPDGHAILYAANPGGKWKIFEISISESGQFGSPLRPGGGLNHSVPRILYGTTFSFGSFARFVSRPCVSRAPRRSSCQRHPVRNPEKPRCCTLPAHHTTICGADADDSGEGFCSGPDNPGRP